jgi:hypothetical protein
MYICSLYRTNGMPWSTTVVPLYSGFYHSVCTRVGLVYSSASRVARWKHNLTLAISSFQEQFGRQLARSQILTMSHRWPNKPSQYSVVVDERVWSPGRSESFWQALLQNELIDTIQFDPQVFSQLSQPQPHDAAAAAVQDSDEAQNCQDSAFANLLLYLETSPNLETVRVRSKASRSGMEHADHLSATTKLCTSLAKNSNIISLTCAAWMPSEPLGQFLATSPSLRYITLALEHYEGIKDTNMVLNGLALSSTMTSLNVSHDPRQGAFWSCNVLQLIDHPTLRNLHISDINDGRSVYMDMALCTSNGHSLKQITIEGCIGIDRGVASILNHLRGHATICSLLLCEISPGALDEAMSALLSCETVHIETLMLRDCRVTEDIWIRLRTALKSKVTVTKLELKKCSFDDEATVDF